jgi:hypothetical protein
MNVRLARKKFICRRKDNKLVSALRQTESGAF